MRLRKGQTAELAIGIVIVFVIGLLILVSSMINTAIRPAIDASDLSSALTNQTLDNVSQGYAFYDIFPLAFTILSLALGGTLLAASLRTHPGFAFIGILGIMIIILTSAQISNAWEAIRTSSNVVDVAQTIPITNLLFTNFPTALLIVGVIITLGLFLKGRGSGGV